MLGADELKGIAVSAGLVLLNIVLMAVMSFTFLASILDLAFRYPIVGIIIYGAMLTVGAAVAKSGVRDGNLKIALAGTALLQFAYGTFGAGILAGLDVFAQTVVLGVTAVVTAVIAAVAGALVYGTGRNFAKWNSYATYSFLGVLLFGFIGTFVPAVLIIAFVLALTGFFIYLVYEIWEMRKTPENFYLNGIGIYVAFMGVFVHILRIVIEILARR